MKFNKRSDGWISTHIGTYDPLEVYLWCQQLYGPCGERWEHWGGNYMFRKESDTIMFILRWA
jgi:hypothetical protein